MHFGNRSAALIPIYTSGYIFSLCLIRKVALTPKVYNVRAHPASIQMLSVTVVRSERCLTLSLCNISCVISVSYHQGKIKIDCKIKINTNPDAASLCEGISYIRDCY